MDLPAFVANDGTLRCFDGFIGWHRAGHRPADVAAGNRLLAGSKPLADDSGVHCTHRALSGCGLGVELYLECADRAGCDSAGGLYLPGESLGRTISRQGVIFLKLVLTVLLAKRIFADFLFKSQRQDRKSAL